MAQYIDKSVLVAKIEKCYNECLKRAKIIDSDYWNAKADAYRNVLTIINDTIEVKDPYEQCVQYDSIKAGIQAHAETYSFNIESVLFPLLTKEQQTLWRKEIEQACISGGEVGVELARDTRYKENVEVKKVDLEKEYKDFVEEDPVYNKLVNGIVGKAIAKHFFELGLKTKTDKELAEEESVPRHSYYETIYHVGKEPRWKVGDVLAYYQFYSDYEGEYDFGKVIKVEFNEKYQDWYYTFEDEDTLFEEELLSEETYKK